MATVEDYLLDNNIISIIVREGDTRRPGVVKHLDDVHNSGGKIFLPLIAIAEIEFGMAKSERPNAAERTKLRDFLNKYPLRCGIDQHAIEPYALIRAELWRTFGTPKINKKGDIRGHVEKLPEDLHDRVTGKSLGIDERDLLIAATAVEYGLVLATNDQNEGMIRIQQACLTLEVAGKPVRLRVEPWP